MDELDPTDCGPQWRMRAFCEEQDSRGIVWPHPIWMIDGASLKTLLTHCHNSVDTRLSHGYVRQFKIGITSDPWRRWAHEPEPCDDMRGYRAEGFHQLQVLFSTSHRGLVGPMEREVLKQYRRYAYETGGLTASGGHLLCANRRQGGENADFGSGPFYLYVAWKFNPGAPELIER